MGTLSGLRHPLFLPYFRHGNLIGHAQGAGTGEPLGALRAEEAVRQSGVPFGKGVGLFWVTGSVSAMKA